MKLPCLLLLSIVSALSLRSEITLAPLFRDHAVLQRDRPLPVWGSGQPGESVRVSLGANTAIGTAGPSGRWQVVLSALPASATPLELVVEGSSIVRVRDLLIGDVWLLSGQSNMEWPVRYSNNADAEMAAANAPTIRHFKTDRTMAHEPRSEVVGSWQAASPETVGHFSAVGYFFAREVQRHLDVPIGLLNSTWGGTPVEAWLPPSALSEFPTRRLAADHFALTTARTAQQLATYEARLTTWRQAGATPPMPTAPWAPGPEIAPGVLYNGMIAPHVPAALRGVLWYQGEANADQPETYEALFQTLITSWRTQFEAPDLPFYWVQLANWDRSNARATNWAQLRDAQTALLSLPHTGQAITLDIGDPDDIHPRNKQDVGRRLARIALAGTYGRRVAHQGPELAGVQREGSALRVTFAHAEGLGGEGAAAPLGFEIAGRDRVFHPAAARVTGNQVILTSPPVREPVAVRYGWSNSPVVSLRNAEGLPAVPFRTDDWPSSR